MNKIELLILFFAPFAFIYMELVLNVIMNPGERFKLNNGKIKGFAKTSLWSYLTYFVATLLTFLIFNLVDFIPVLVILKVIIYIIISGIVCINWEIIIGIIYTKIGARHWDYRETGLHYFNIIFANFFKGHTDLVHILVYFSIQVLAYFVWGFLVKL